jgi:hypothetical protein
MNETVENIARSGVKNKNLYLRFSNKESTMPIKVKKTMKNHVIYGKPITPGVAEGEAIVSSESISFLGGFDPKTGKIVERGHPLEGIDLSNKILVIYSSKGSSAGVFSLYVAKANGKAPSGLLTCAKDAIIGGAVIISEIPAVRLQKIDLRRIKTGDHIRIDGSSGKVEVI